MQRFERRDEPPPAHLQGSEATHARKVMADFFAWDDERIAQTSVPPFKLELDNRSVRESLARLFRGKCAFCESVVETVSYRFRPVAEALPLEKGSRGHLYYAWLADAWENIYPICQPCSPSRPDHFPVRGKRAELPDQSSLERYAAENVGLWRDYPPSERPLLLEPCVQWEYAPHFEARLSGEIVGLTDRAEATLNHFSLNRDDVIRRRSQVYANYLTQLMMPPEDDLASWLFEFPKLEFGGTWYLILRRLALASVVRGAHVTLSRAQIKGFFARGMRRPTMRRRIERALQRLDEKPAVRSDDAKRLPTRSVPFDAPALSSVKVENFKALESIELKMPKPPANAIAQGLAQRPALLILGENATGKSSLLEAIALALSDQWARDELDLKTESFVLDPEQLGGEGGELGRVAKVSLTFEGGDTHSVVIDDQGFREEGDEDLALPPVFAYGAFRQYLDERRRQTPAKSVKNLFKSDTILSNPEEWLLGLDIDDFRMVVRALRDILSIEGEFDVIERDHHQRRCFIRMAAFAGGTADRYAKTPLLAASSGFRAILAMVCDIMQGLMEYEIDRAVDTLKTAHAIVLIDEIEAHLHPRWKMQIMHGLRRALPGATFIATTHDPLCLRGMEDGEVMVLQRVASLAGNAPTDLPQFVEKLVGLPNVAHLTVEQLLTSDFFRLLSCDAPETERCLADMADLLARRARLRADPAAETPLSLAEQDALKKFDREIAEALPVGLSEAQRLVQEAVAEFLRERRNASAERLKSLHSDSKQRILEILRAV